MRYIVSGKLTRSVEGETEQQMPLSVPIMLVEGGMVVTRGAIAQLDDSDAFAWIVALREQQAIRVPIAQAGELLEQMLTLPRIPPMQLPSELSHERVEIRPRPRLLVKRPEKNHWYGDRLEAQLSFDYAGEIVPYTDESSGIFQPVPRRFIVRDRNAEREAMARLLEVGVRGGNFYGNIEILQIAPNSLPAIVRKLTADNWHIEADGKLYRQPGAMKIEVSSGVDWFELHGSADFDGQSVKLPALLAALRKGDKTVVLGDGSLGVLPEEWLRKYGALAGMGTEEGDHLQFRRSQIGLLDALLASQPEATCDAVFQQARERLLRFEGIAAADAPQGFIGSLRPYQREGLGWISFLREFSFGGCLADDMGLGKTVQVLALLEGRRELNAKFPPGAPERRPSLVVAHAIANFQLARGGKPLCPAAQGVRSDRHRAGQVNRGVCSLRSDPHDVWNASQRCADAQGFSI